MGSVRTARDEARNLAGVVNPDLLSGLQPSLPPSAAGCTVLRSVVRWLPMTRTVQARLDQRAESDLALLRSETGNDSEAIRLALRESAGLRRRRSALRAEAESAAADADDVAESRLVREDMDLVAAPWPET